MFCSTNSLQRLSCTTSDPCPNNATITAPKQPPTKPPLTLETTPRRLQQLLQNSESALPKHRCLGTRDARPSRSISRFTSQRREHAGIRWRDPPYFVLRPAGSRTCIDARPSLQSDRDEAACERMLCRCTARCLINENVPTRLRAS